MHIHIDHLEFEMNRLYRRVQFSSLMIRVNTMLDLLCETDHMLEWQFHKVLELAHVIVW